MTNEQLSVVNKDLASMGLENIRNIILIEKRATNGDVIKAMFPKLDASVSGDGDVIDVYNLGIYCQTFDTDWWNEPYKAHSEE